MNTQERWYRVKIGFDEGYISIPENMLAKAIYAKMTGGMFFYGNSMKDGKLLMSIDPDYHRYTGWNEDYLPQSRRDYEDIERYCPRFDGYLDAATTLAIEAQRAKDPLMLEKQLLLLES